MNTQNNLNNPARRRFLRQLASGVFVVAGVGALRAFSNEAFADELVRTPAQTEGPYYPDHLPLDTDNDLIVINKSLTPAVGEITHLSGRITDAKGEPLKGAVIEIWQVDSKGVYIHSRDPHHGAGDANFQGYGRFETASNGEYRFRTIKPVAYPGRTPHIHVKVSKGERELLTTQCYVQGETQNERDGVLRGIRDERQRASVIVPFAPVKDSKIGELAAKFDIVLGYTPAA